MRALGSTSTSPSGPTTARSWASPRARPDAACGKSAIISAALLSTKAQGYSEVRPDERADRRRREQAQVFLREGRQAAAQVEDRPRQAERFERGRPILEQAQAHGQPPGCSPSESGCGDDSRVLPPCLRESDRN